MTHLSFIPASVKVIITECVNPTTINCAFLVCLSVNVTWCDIRLLRLIIVSEVSYKVNVVQNYTMYILTYDPRVKVAARMSNFLHNMIEKNLLYCYNCEMYLLKFISCWKDLKHVLVQTLQVRGVSEVRGVRGDK